MNPDLALKHPPVVASMASQRSWLVMLLAASAGGLIAYVGLSGLINAGLANDLLSQIEQQLAFGDRWLACCGLGRDHDA